MYLGDGEFYKNFLQHKNSVLKFKFFNSVFIQEHKTEINFIIQVHYLFIWPSNRTHFQ